MLHLVAGINGGIAALLLATSEEDSVALLLQNPVSFRRFSVLPRTFGLQSPVLPKSFLLNLTSHPRLPPTPS